MSLRDWIQVATPATPATLSIHQRPTVAKVATVARGIESAEGTHWRWQICKPDGWGEVRCTPAATRAQVAELYPSASMEPLPDTAPRAATPAQADELRGLIAAILADDTDTDRAEALAIALADPDAALACYRALAAIRQWHGGCR